MSVDYKFKILLKRHLRMSGLQNERNIKYDFEELKELCSLATEVLKSEPMVGELKPPVVIVGDVHGQYFDLLRLFALFNTEAAHGALCNKYVFLGDYVDRGSRSVECIVLLLLLKVNFPKKFILLRGNHECRTINRVYGFHDEITERFTEEEAPVLYNSFNQVFEWMPLAALVGKRVLCMHGGISPQLKSIDDIRKIDRPLPDPSVNALAMDLLWADPMVGLNGYCSNGTRGVSVYFGEDAVKDTCEALGLDLIVRGHQLMLSGHGFFANRKLCTVFSAPNYQINSLNKGAAMFITPAGKVGFKLLHHDKSTEDAEADRATVSTPSAALLGTMPATKKKRVVRVRNFQSASCTSTQGKTE